MTLSKVRAPQGEAMTDEEKADEEWILHRRIEEVDHELYLARMRLSELQQERSRLAAALEKVQA